MERTIPGNLNHRIISSVFTEADIKPQTPENYIKAIEFIEHKWENYLIDILSKMNINATVKSDKYSLPYNDEIVFRKTETALFPKVYYRFMEPLREFVKTILQRNLLKIRFYILIDLKIVEPMKIREFEYGQVDMIIRFRFHGN